MATLMSQRSSMGIHSEVRDDFSTKEGSYRNVKASLHCRPNRQPLFGKELSPVQVSMVSCKGKDGVCEWIVFNSGKELYFYRFEGVGKVGRGLDLCNKLLSLITKQNNPIDFPSAWLVPR